MKKKLYYHVYLTDEYGSWAYPIMEQIKLMEDSGLLLALNDIVITCVSQNDQRIHTFAHLLNSFNLRATINVYHNTHSNDSDMLNSINGNSTITENVMMQKIYEESQLEDYQLLYVHTKGITSIDNHLKKGNVNQFVTYYYWRKLLEWGTIERWQEAVRLLDRFDIVGVNYYDNPSPHFSGSFWWANSSYIRTLPDPSTLDWWMKLQNNTKDHWLKTASDRFRDEMWHCSNPDVKVCSLKNFSQDMNPSAHRLPRKAYVG